MNRRALAAMLLSTGLLASCGGGGESASSPSAVATSTSQVTADSSATVVRVKDGDTIVVKFAEAAEETTVRLLNIDAPETKHPNKDVECMGPEATEYLSSLLPVGSRVDLEYDTERRDSYDRTLAGVYKGETLVNAEIARRGLGTAVAFDPNHRFYSEVLAAQAEAEKQGVGLYDSEKECTIPSQIQTISKSLEAAAADSVDGVIQQAEQLEQKLSGFVEGSNVWLAKVLASDSVSSRRSSLNDLITEKSKWSRSLAQQSTAAKTSAPQPTPEESYGHMQQQQNPSAEQDQQSQQYTPYAPAQEEPQWDREEQDDYAEPQQSEESSEYEYGYEYRERQDSDPGYRGPRCYAPGGRSWRPC